MGTTPPGTQQHQRGSKTLDFTKNSGQINENNLLERMHHLFSKSFQEVVGIPPGESAGSILGNPITG